MSEMSSNATSLGAAKPAPGPCVPWGFWGTSAWTAAAIAAWAAMQFSVFVGMFIVSGVGDNLSPREIEAFASHAVALSLISILAAPVEIGIIALAIRFARCRFGDYLALVRPPRRELLIGLACLAVLLPASDLYSYLSGRTLVPSFVMEAYRTGRDSGTLWLLGFAIVVAAPVTEEIVFRGFMFRGFAASKVGLAGAIVLPSAIWAVMHVQYEAYYIVLIFVLGLLFGWLRWRSGSTTVTIVLHGAVNLASLVQTAVIAEKFS